MSRYSHGATATVGRRGRWLALAALAASLLLAIVLVPGSSAKGGKTTVTLGQTSTVPDPSCPETPCQAVGSVTGFQVNNGQTRNSVPGSAQGHDQVLDADPGAADELAALLLQRLLRHPAGGAPLDHPPRPRHQPAALQPAPAGLDQGALALPRPDGQVQRQPQGRKARHRRDLRADLGADLRPGPDHDQRLARQPRNRQVHQLDRHPPGRTADEDHKRATYGCKYTTARLLYTATLVWND